MELVACQMIAAKWFPISESVCGQFAPLWAFSAVFLLVRLQRRLRASCVNLFVAEMLLCFATSKPGPCRSFASRATTFALDAQL